MGPLPEQFKDSIVPTTIRPTPVQRPRNVRDAAEAGVDEVFVDLGQMTTTTTEMVEIAGEFIDALRTG